MSNETIEMVKARKYYYRDNYRRLCNALLILLMVILLLILAIAFLAITRSVKNYYATSYVSELIPLKEVPRGTGLPNPEKEPVQAPAAK